MKNILLMLMVFGSFGALGLDSTSNNSEGCDNTNFEIDKPEYAETEEERVARLNQELMAALNQFDRCFDTLNKSTSSSDSSKSNNSNSSSSIASNTASGNEPITTQEQPLNTAPDQNSINNTSVPIEDIPGDNGSIPSDTPYDPSDDRTARQLWDEANATKDPKLRELYFDGYRKYKGAQKNDG